MTKISRDALILACGEDRYLWITDITLPKTSKLSPQEYKLTIDDRRYKIVYPPSKYMPSIIAEILKTRKGGEEKENFISVKVHIFLEKNYFVSKAYVNDPLEFVAL